MGEMEGMGKRETLVHQGLRGREEWLVVMGQLGRRVNEETQVCRESQDYRVHQEEEQSTLAGVGPPAPLTRELSSSMLAELVGHTITTKEEQQITCVYQMILTISSTRVEYKGEPIFVE